MRSVKTKMYKEKKIALSGPLMTQAFGKDQQPRTAAMESRTRGLISSLVEII